MVCNRCIAAVQAILTHNGWHPIQVTLGEAIIQEEEMSVADADHLKKALQSQGFEWILDRHAMLVEKIKNIIITQIHHRATRSNKNFSTLISEALHLDYTYLSKLFSEAEGITIEQYIILQKIERVKELIVYDELSLTQIADELHYSSIAHLSNQFKKVTGMTPSAYKQEQHKQRKPLDKIG